MRLVLQRIGCRSRDYVSRSAQEPAGGRGREAQARARRLSRSTAPPYAPQRHKHSLRVPPDHNTCAASARRRERKREGETGHRALRRRSAPHSLAARPRRFFARRRSSLHAPSVPNGRGHGHGWGRGRKSGPVPVHLLTKRLALTPSQHSEKFRSGENVLCIPAASPVPLCRHFC